MWNIAQLKFNNFQVVLKKRYFGEIAINGEGCGYKPLRRRFRRSDFFKKQIKKSWWKGFWRRKFGGRLMWEKISKDKILITKDLQETIAKRRSHGRKQWRRRLQGNVYRDDWNKPTARLELAGATFNIEDLTSYTQAKIVSIITWYLSREKCLQVFNPSS